MYVMGKVFGHLPYAHKGVYYICIPFPDDGIYVCSCTDIDKGNWTKPWCLIAGKGYEDPCPIWLGDKCYLVLAFAKVG